MQREKYKVLLVDDSEDDRFFMRRALHRNPKLTVSWEAHDGVEALAYLKGQDQFKDRKKYPLPDLLMVDLKMPRKTGYDLLQWLQSQPFPQMMVAVISGSFLPEDIDRCFSLGVHAYYKKSAIKEEQEVMLREIEEALAKRHSDKP